MGDPAKDEAIKKRIIEHMNTDHRDSLRLYLQHKHNLDLKTAASAKLVDINNSQVIIIAAGKSYTLPIEPPMASLKEARTRLVAMDEDARKALGVPKGASALVPRYVSPAGFDLVVWFAVVSTLIVFSRQQNVQPGSILYDQVLKNFPAFATFCQRIQYKLFWGMIVVHGSEAALIGFRLSRYGVPVGSSLWLKWVVGCFFDGICSHMRLTILAKKQKSAKANGAANGKAN